MCEKKTMQTRPGMNHFRVVPRSAPACSQVPTLSEKKAINRMKTILMEALINKEEEAIVDFSGLASLLLT